MWKNLPINIRQRVRQRTGFRLPGRRTAVRGFTIKGMREFEAGDSSRALSRRHYVRSGEELVIEKFPERNASILILFDISASVHIGGARKKYQAQLDLLYQFGWACLWKGHRLRVIAFAVEVELESPVITNISTLVDVVDRLAVLGEGLCGTSHHDVFERAASIAGHPGHPADLICIISDFLFPFPRQDFFRDLDDLLDMADVIALVVRDRVEVAMPAMAGALLIRDAESSVTFWAGGTSGFDPVKELDSCGVDNCVLMTSQSREEWFEVLADLFTIRLENS